MRSTSTPGSELRPSTDAERLPRGGIRAIAEIARRNDDVIDLVLGEPDFPTPAHVADAGIAAVRAGRTRYAPGRGVPELREAAARSLARRSGASVSSEEITVTAGGVQGLFGALAVLAERGASVLVPDPGWPNYIAQCQILGLHPVRYPLDAARDFAPDLERLERLAVEHRPRALLLNSPANPTGALLAPEVVSACVELARRHQLWIISDEVYDQIVFDGVHAYLRALAPERTVSVYSCSKTYAMTGWRVGYAWAAPEIAALIGKVLELEASCAAMPSQVAAAAALDGPQACVEQMRTAYAERRDLAVRLLRETGLFASCPRGAFYVMVDVSGHTADTVALATDLAARPAGVACAPGEAFGPGGRGLLRVSLAAAPEAIAEGIRRIACAVGAARTS